MGRGIPRAAFLFCLYCGGAGAVVACGNTTRSGPAPTAENCTDGVDNDGNGLVDCADPACTPGYTCVPSPAGWTVGSFLSSFPDQTAPSCPTGYSAGPRAVQEPGSVTCSCACGMGCGDFDCASGALTVTADTADGGCSDGAPIEVPAFGCVPFDASAGASLRLSQPAFSASFIVSMGDDTFRHPDARLCGASATGGGCGAGSACVPRPPHAWSLCSFRSSEVSDGPYTAVGTCAEGWVDAVTRDGGIPAVHPVATAWDDRHACSDCSCVENPEAGCAGATLTFHADPSCQSPLLSLASSTCAAMPADAGWVQYSATPVNAGCVVSRPSQPTGLEISAPDAGYIVCCAVAP